MCEQQEDVYAEVRQIIRNNPGLHFTLRSNQKIHPDVVLPIAHKMLGMVAGELSREEFIAPGAPQLCEGIEMFNEESDQFSQGFEQLKEKFRWVGINLPPNAQFLVVQLLEVPGGCKIVHGSLVKERQLLMQGVLQAEPGSQFVREWTDPRAYKTAGEIFAKYGLRRELIDFFDWYIKTYRPSEESKG